MHLMKTKLLILLCAVVLFSGCAHPCRCVDAPEIKVTPE